MIETLVADGLKKLTGKDLAGFQVVMMTEVYRTDVDGFKHSSIGFFRDKTIAEAFAGAQSDPSYHKTALVPVLTDGKVAFIVNAKEPVNLYDDEAEALRIREKIINKLTRAERRILGV